MAVADREVADALRRSFLGRLPGDVVDELVAGGQRTDYPAGSMIYREGAAARAVLVVQGLLRVFMTSPDGRQVTVRYAREADVLGIAVIVGGPVNVAVQTITDASLFSIDAPLLTEAARRDAGVGWALAEELNRRLYDTLQQTAINTFGSVRQRVAAALLDLASAQQRLKDPLVAQVSQQELADAVGSVREVVARTLREFRLAGLVATGPDSVLIVDPTRLHEQCWPAATE